MKTPKKPKGRQISNTDDSELNDLDQELKDLISENESLKEGISKILKKIDDTDKTTNSN